MGDGVNKSNRRLSGRTHSKKKLVVKPPDVVIPIVFPDYKISTPVGKLPYLGHAGVLFINSSNGRTKYYEYGRYDKANLGVVRRRIIPDVEIAQDGRPTEASFIKTLHVISKKAGHSGRIKAVYIEVDNGFKKMLEYTETRKKDNDNPKRKPYGLISNNCVSFVIETAKAGNPKLRMLWAVHRPNSYIDELRQKYTNLDYEPKTKKLKLKVIKPLGEVIKGYMNEVFEFFE